MITLPEDDAVNRHVASGSQDPDRKFGHRLMVGAGVSMGEEDAPTWSAHWEKRDAANHERWALTTNGRVKTTVQ